MKRLSLSLLKLMFLNLASQTTLMKKREEEKTNIKLNTYKMNTVKIIIGTKLS